MAKDTRAVRDPHQKEIIRLFSAFDGSKNRWKIFTDFLVMTACMYSNLADLQHREAREEIYLRYASQYKASELDIFAKMIAEIVMGIEDNPDQDFLGEMYMALNFGSDSAGQFFTPYSVCRLMAAMQDYNLLKSQIEKKGFIGVSDPACGAGALLMAFANEAQNAGVNPQMQIMFVAQDIDFTVGCMCYIGLCVRGFAGYVVIGDTLSNPSTCYDSRGLLPKDNDNVWYTPMFLARDIWAGRRLAASMDLLAGGIKKPEKQNSEAPKKEELHRESTETPLQHPENAFPDPSLVEISHEEEKPVEALEIGYSENDAGQLCFF